MRIEEFARSVIVAQYCTITNNATEPISGSNMRLKKTSSLVSEVLCLTSPNCCICVVEAVAQSTLACTETEQKEMMYEDMESQNSQSDRPIPELSVRRLAPSEDAFEVYARGWTRMGLRLGEIENCCVISIGVPTALIGR
jgi:hypothetical protein